MKLLIVVAAIVAGAFAGKLSGVLKPSEIESKLSIGLI